MLPTVVLHVEPCTDYRGFKSHDLCVFTMVYDNDRHIKGPAECRKLVCVVIDFIFCNLFYFFPLLVALFSFSPYTHVQCLQ
jgi:hypothetical protein